MSSTWDFIPFWGERHWRLHWLGRKKNTDEQQRDGFKRRSEVDGPGRFNNFPMGCVGIKSKVFGIIIFWFKDQGCGKVAGIKFFFLEKQRNQPKQRQDQGKDGLIPGSSTWECRR